jgi:hypothetical protein
MKAGRWAVILLSLWGVFLQKEAQAQAPFTEHVLFVGDSHTVGGFGYELDRWIRSNLSPSATTSSYGSCASRISSWYAGFYTNCGFIRRSRRHRPDLHGRMRPDREGSTPRLMRLLRRYRPGLTVVELGANNVGYRSSYNRRWIARMAQDIAQNSGACVWVGPPRGRNKPPAQLEQFYSDLRELAGPYCVIVDSRESTYYPNQGGDGAHFDPLGAEGQAISRRWAWQAAKAIEPFLP